MEIIIPQTHWLPVLPVALITVSVLLILILGAFLRSARPYLHPFVLTVLSGLIILWFLGFRQPLTSFSDMVVIDKIAYTSGLMLFIGMWLLILSLASSVDMNKTAEFYTVLLIALLGMLVMIMTQHLLLIYMGLEILSIAIYILAGMNRTRPKSLEAAFKYFFLGAFSSAFFLYGVSLLYGSTGSFQLDSIQLFFRNHTADPLPVSLIGLIFILGGIAFKISLIPFHMAAPDVYEGNPSPITVFIATIPKIAVFVIFFRIIAVSAMSLHPSWSAILYGLIFLTVIGGNLLALIQNDLKRMMAYSGVAHAGYLSLMIMTAPLLNPDKTFGILSFYLLIYTAMNLVVFINLFSVEMLTGKDPKIDHFNGFAEKNPLHAFFMSVSLFSLAGIPLTGGFMAKWQAFALSIEAGYIVLTVISVLTVLISVYYYLRIVVRMYFYPSSDESTIQVKTSSQTTVVLWISTLMIILSGLYPGLFAFTGI